MPTGSRRLAAIMFTDIVGFTALTQRNEAEAMRLLARHNQILRPFFERFHGREIKTIGDSFLVEFESALDATNCAVEIQKSLLESTPSRSGAVTLRLRIGVHLGDVIHSEGDVLGDTVNIASRIEPLADPGGVCVSGQVFDQVQNKMEIQFEKLGTSELKNVQVPIAVYRVRFPIGRGKAPPVQPDPSSPRRLAVLPFTNMSPDPQDEFFADGLTEETIAELSRIPRLRVIARTSVMRYKTTPKPIGTVGAELRVNYVLEGSVRKAANRIRITAQLIDASTEEHLWTERFDRELADIFAVQADIASNVAHALDLRFQETSAVAKASPTQVEAYTLYLRARYLWNQRTSPSVRAALRHFEEAIEIDPSFSLAYCGLADSYSILVDRGDVPAEDALDRALAVAKKALELDPKLAETHASMSLALSQSSDFIGAERELRKALELNPGLAMAHHWLAGVLGALGRASDAADEAAKAEESDPLSVVVLNNAGLHAWIRGQDERAMARWEHALEISPTSEIVNINRILFLVSKSRRKEASEVLRAFESGTAEPLSKLWVGACGHAALGNRSETVRRVEEMRALPKERQFPPNWFGFVYAILGDFDRAFEILLSGPAALAGSSAMFLRLYPTFEKFRSDPRFATLARRWDDPRLPQSG